MTPVEQYDVARLLWLVWGEGVTARDVLAAHEMMADASLESWLASEIRSAGLRCEDDDLRYVEEDLPGLLLTAAQMEVAIG